MVTDKQLAEWRNLADDAYEPERSMITALLDEVERLRGEVKLAYEDPESAYAGQGVRDERDALRARCDRLEAVADIARGMCEGRFWTGDDLSRALAALDAEGGER